MIKNWLSISKQKLVSIKYSFVLLVLLFIGFTQGWAQPTAQTNTFAIVGDQFVASSSNGSGNAFGPNNTRWRRRVMHVVYTKAELEAAGLVAGSTINQLAWFVSSISSRDIPSYTISFKHTTAANAAASLGTTGWTTVRNAATWFRTSQVVNQWNAFDFTTDFVWNGVDNIGIQVCWGRTSDWDSNGGSVIGSTVTSGYRHRQTDDSGNSCGEDPNVTFNWRPNIRLRYRSCNYLQVPELTGNAAINCGQTTTLTPFMPSGGTISDNGDWRIHTFNTVGANTGTFTTSHNWYANVVVVAGGGGGGANNNSGNEGSGGGGGGGVVNRSLSINSNTNISVGGGGSGGSGTTWPNAGSNSSFGAITATGGGRGARSSSGTNYIGGSGGTGGGASRNGTPGSGTWPQGFGGGFGVDARGGGGGGGAGRFASNGSGDNGGAGGDGIQCGPNGILGFFGGGGGGGARNNSPGSGGNGGGASGGTNNNIGNNGTANTGGGGGGAGRRSQTGGAGGSGTVRVVYLNNTGGGTWNSDNIAVATVNPSGVVSAVGPGTATITYTVTKQGCTATQTKLVTVSNCGSITTGTITGSPFCASANVSVPFTVSGTYNAGNIFTAQLSNSSGSFASPVNIGQVTQTTNGTISATIPSNASSDSGYRIRVVSSNPAITGADNGTNITITAQPNAAISYAGPFCASIASAQPVNRTGTAGGTYTSSPSGLSINATTGAITPSLSTPNTYTVTYTIPASGGCALFSTTATVEIVATTPAPTVNAGANLALCEGTAFNFAGASITGGYTSVSWNKIGGTASGNFTTTNSNNPAAWVWAPTTTGTAIFELVVTGQFGAGCGVGTVSDTRTITWDALPVVDAGTAINSCSGSGNIQMQGATVTGSYTSPVWSDNVGTGNWNQNSTPSAALYTPATNSGSLTATLTVYGTGGCASQQVSNTRQVNWNIAPIINSVSFVNNNNCDINNPNGAIFVNASGSSFITLSIDNGANYSGNFQPASLVGGSYNIVVKMLITVLHLISIIRLY
jgi:hypothetical protein